MRYTMNGPVKAAGAFMPQMPTTPAGSSGGLVRVFGQPGTMGIAAPRPGALPPVSQVPWTQNSHCSPDVIFPDLYIPFADNMHAPMLLKSTNELPVPAVNLYNMASVAMRSRRTGTNTQIPQPFVAQSWPAWKGTGRG